MLPRLLVLPLLVSAALTGCSSQSCDALAGMQAERERQRAAYTELTAAGSATPDEVTAAHDALHAYEARVYDVEQECSGR